MPFVERGKILDEATADPASGVAVRPIELEEGAAPVDKGFRFDDQHPRDAGFDDVHWLVHEAAGPSTDKGIGVPLSTIMIGAIQNK